MAPPSGLHIVDRPGTDGAGLLVVIVHGAMDRSSSFGRVDRRLRDRHVLRYDRRGYGRSAAVGVGGMDDHVDDLLAVLDGRPAVVFGHSIGAVVALVAACRRPEIVRAVLAYEPPTPWAPWWPSKPSAEPALDSGDVAETFMREAVGDRIWQRLPSRTREDRRREGAALLADQQSLEHGRPFEPASLTVPVVVGVGSETTWWHRRAAEELGAEIHGAELTVVDGAQHGVHLSHAATIEELVRELLITADGPPNPETGGGK